ncbi:hypothetical protein LJC18_02725 [Lachnospiraceae bacterium OttesenSCG-928-E19]|nr:hypothetical protein [Lachnospiraceae bacterium OttesenSCG-928-E19]
MKSNTLKIIINRPVSDVFEFTTNPNNTDKWFVDAGKEWTNEWPRKLGTIYENNNGFLTVTEFELDKLFTLTKKDEFFVRYTYRDLGDGKTEMTYTEESLIGDLDSVTDMTPMEKLKEIMES